MLLFFAYPFLLMLLTEDTRWNQTVIWFYMHMEYEYTYM